MRQLLSIYREYSSVNLEKEIYMQSLLIIPKDEAELELLSALLARLNITTTVIAEDDREDVGLGILLQQADRSEHVSCDSISKAMGRAPMSANS